MVSLFDWQERLERAADLLEQREDGASRRKALAALAGAAGLVAASPAAITPLRVEGNRALLMLRRISYGPTEAEVARIKRVGAETYVRQQLEVSRISDTACDQAVAERYPRVAANLTAKQLAQMPDDWRTIQALGEATIYRAVNSNRQLLERTVEFWLDHFNVHIDKPGGWLMAPYVNKIRSLAFGKFHDLLRAVAFSPAMLWYLDNVENDGDMGNVNFARELMELHTISVEGGYTPTDIRNVQRCFSGWSLEWDSNSPRHGEFVFNEWAHSTLPKVVMGQNVPPGGQSEGEWVLQFLANHPSTRTFICRKLCRFFLGYEPPARILQAATSVWQRTGGDIKSVLRAILTNRNMLSATPKFKRPYHLIIGAMRSMRAMTDVEMWTLRYDFMDRAGQMPYDWEPPDGYPDRLDYWGNLLLPRWNFALSLPRNYVWGVQVDIEALLGTATTPTAIADRISSLLMAGEMKAADRTQLIQFLSAGSLDVERKQGAFALAIASPSYQWF